MRSKPLQKVRHRADGHTSLHDASAFRDRPHGGTSQSTVVARNEELGGETPHCPEKKTAGLGNRPMSLCEPVERYAKALFVVARVIRSNTSLVIDQHQPFRFRSAKPCEIAVNRLNIHRLRQQGEALPGKAFGNRKIGVWHGSNGLGAASKQGATRIVARYPPQAAGDERSMIRMMIDFVVGLDRFLGETATPAPVCASTHAWETTSVKR